MNLKGADTENPCTALSQCVLRSFCYSSVLFAGSSHIIKALHNSIIGLLGNIGKLAAPGLFSLLVALLESRAHLFDFARVAAGQSGCKIQNPLGGLLYTPVSVLGNISCACALVAGSTVKLPSLKKDQISLAFP